MAGKKTTTFRRLDIAGFTIAVLLGAITLMASGAAVRRQTATLTAEQQALTNELTHLTGVAGTLQTAADALTTFKARQEELNARLPEAIDFQSFYEELTNHAELCNVVITQILPGNIEEADDYREMKVSVIASAPFDAIHQLLFDITSLQRLTTLDHVSLIPSDPPSLCYADLVVSIYALKESGDAHGI